MSDAASPINSRLLIALLAVCGALLIGVVVVIVLLLNRDGQPAAAAPSPAATESPTPTPTADPVQAQTTTTQVPQPHAYFSLFSPGQDKVKCVNSSFGPPTIDVGWDSEYAVSAWIWFDTDDAYNTLEIPLSGGGSDIPEGFTYPCDHTEATFIITLVGQDGGHVSQTWKVVNTGEVF